LLIFQYSISIDKVFSLQPIKFYRHSNDTPEAKGVIFDKTFSANSQALILHDACGKTAMRPLKLGDRVAEKMRWDGPSKVKNTSC
jgi:hypothetical protein